MNLSALVLKHLRGVVHPRRQLGSYKFCEPAQLEPNKGQRKHRKQHPGKGRRNRRQNQKHGRITGCVSFIWQQDK